MNITRKSMKTLLFLTGLVAVSALYTYYNNIHGRKMEHVTSSYLLILGFAFYRYVRWVIVQEEARKNLSICAIHILCILLIRGARYTAFVQYDQLMRYLWYIYYIPLLLVPYYSLRAAYSIGKTEKITFPWWIRLSGIISHILSLLVLTNDFHQLIFRLHPGFWINWRDEYDRAFFYYVVFAWMAILLIGSFMMLVDKCRVTSSRKYVWLPILPILTGTIWLFLIAIDMVPKINGGLMVEFPEAFAFTVAGAWICCIQIGLVPANIAYADLFQISSIGAYITDQKDRIIYRSHALKDQKMVQTRKHAIEGGYVYWQTDVSELNRMNEQLFEIHQQLKDETELLRLENELKEKRAVIEAQNNLYDAIASNVSAQSQKIAALAGEAMADETKSQENLKQICVYGSYIKRMANLMILAQQKEELNLTELSLSINESLRQLKKMEIKTFLYQAGEDRYFPSQHILRVYELFEQCIEQQLPYLAGVSVTLDGDICKVVLEGEGIVPMEDQEGMNSEWDEDTCFVNLSLTERRGDHEAN